MTPKEKAKELIDTYRYALSIPNSPLGDYKDNITKQCALIAVDEILASHYKVLTGIHPTTYDYFIEVKKEIELL